MTGGMEDREERVKMRREFEERRKGTGAKKESKGEWLGGRWACAL